MENFGALVGWRHDDHGGRIMLCLESVRSAAAADLREPDFYRLLMTKQQAAILGNCLVQISGHTPIDPKDRSWFRRLFG